MINHPMTGVDNKAWGYPEEEGAPASGFRARAKLWRLISSIFSLLTAVVTIGI